MNKICQREKSYLLTVPNVSMYMVLCESLATACCYCWCMRIWKKLSDLIFSYVQAGVVLVAGFYHPAMRSASSAYSQLND